MMAGVTRERRDNANGTWRDWVKNKARERRHTLLTELGSTLLDGGHDHITDGYVEEINGGRFEHTGRGQHVKCTLDTSASNDVEVLGTSVISTVHDSRNRQTKSSSEFLTSSSSTS